MADLNIDMIGRTDKEHEGKADYVYVIGSDKLSSELHAINEAANKKYTNIDLDYRFNDPEDPNRFYYRSDHYNFAKHKIPGSFLLQRRARRLPRRRRRSRENRVSEDGEARPAGVLHRLGIGQPRQTHRG